MRRNRPVSQPEYTLRAEQTIVSVTATQGRITCCNPAFVEASGLSRDERPDQPHPLLRHPGMPAEAFCDMWATLQPGRPRTGVVENRRKNGDHHGVDANAAPMKDDERIVGDLWVRTPAAAGAVAGAETRHAHMNDDAARGHRRIAEIIPVIEGLAFQADSRLQTGRPPARGTAAHAPAPPRAAVGPALAVSRPPPRARGRGRRRPDHFLTPGGRAPTGLPALSRGSSGSWPSP
ncbi:MAG: hypothetical protein C0505_10655 [Leptothrix sp. (in: Bacteria)]|nr:hypothetical protein [Leptothrix sp. (in: b-proteobacteria)]